MLFNYGFVYALVAILLWSSAATVAGILTNSANFLTITISLQIGGIGFFASWLYLSKTYEESFISLKKLIKKQKIKNYLIFNLVMFSFFITLYYLLFYYSIQNAPKIQANILNYLWPMLTPLLGIYLFKNEKKDFGYYQVFLLFLSFVGALLVAWDITLDNPFSSFHLEYIYAILGAFSAALYLNFIFKLKRYMASTQLLYLIALIISLPFSILIAYLFDVEINFTLSSLPWLLYLGVVVFGFGQYLLVKSIEIDNMVTISALAYITPLISSLMLNMFLNEPLTNTIVFGAVLIVFSNIMLSNYFSHFYAVNGALIAFVSVGLVAYINPYLINIEYFQENNINKNLGIIFSILTGFILSKVWNKNQQEDIYLIEINELLKTLSLENKDQRKDIYKFIQQVAHLDFSITSKEVQNTTKKVLESFNNINSITKKDKIVLKKVQLILNKWLMLKVDKIGKTQLILLTTLGGLIIFDFLYKIGQNFYLDITAMFFSSAIVYIILLVRDYSHGRTEYDIFKIFINQSVVEKLDETYYLPSSDMAPNMNTYYMHMPKFKIYKIKSTISENKNLEEGAKVTKLLSIIINITIIILVYLLYNKY